MSALASRRGFLSGLATLPLIGGSVALIGTPSAVAEPASKTILAGYSEWLRIERSLLHRELFPDLDPALAKVMWAGGASWVDDFFIPPGPASWRDMPMPSTRAALVLSAVGCSWREGGR